MGLREEIRHAKSESEIGDLLKKGKNFEFASQITKNAWKSTARFRLAELNNSIPVQNPETPIQPKKPKKKRS